MKASFFLKRALSALMMLPLEAAADNVIANFDMTLHDGSIVETVTQNAYEVVCGKLSPVNVDGARGEALRLDGYTNYVVAKLPEQDLSQFTFSLWCAVEGYPMMNTNEAETTASYSTIAGNLDETQKKGFAIMLSSQGDLKVRYCSGGWGPYDIVATKKLERAKWAHLVLMLKADGKLYLYNNGEQVAIGRTLGSISLGTADFYIGKSAATLTSGLFNINTFCGLIDDIKLLDTAQTDLVDDNAAECEPNFRYPASRYQSDTYARLWRPDFHGMPSGGWTNESHGMAYSNGRYHLFFQKNPNGPYMARLNWGHLSSENLYNWREENIAFGPSESYDIKGCWSGCVFSDDVLTDGVPTAFYTAVDNGNASICSATPQDDDLLTWTKSQGNPLISSRPSGLSDDFRDCYVFKHDDDFYMIVGSSKNDVGVCTLHRYNAGSWTNDGTIFFSAASKSLSGRFFEMPNVTPMGGESYLFTATPLETSVGVETQYWIGTIASDGTFNASTTTPGKIELDGFSKEGYGMLSPTVFQHDGKTIAMGIVPDKLSAAYNYQIGWAHNYSLPREWTLEDGELVQKPYSGLSNMRTATAYTMSNQTVSDRENLGNVSGRAVEVEAEFEVGTSDFGLSFLSDGTKGATLKYSPLTNMLSLDLTGVARITNDDGVFDGVYQSSLPTAAKSGETMKMHVFFDHSIFDIFINDRWAASVRVFPTDESADGVQVCADGEVVVKSLKAWTLNPEQTTGIRTALAENVCNDRTYNIVGQVVGDDYKGIVVKNGKKYYKR